MVISQVGKKTKVLLSKKYNKFQVSCDIKEEQGYAEIKAFLAPFYFEYSN